MTNAGALLADDSPVRHSRLFCTRWAGLDKSSGLIDAIDSAEYSGSLIILLNEGIGFIRRNMKTMWKKTPDSRIEMPDYCERSFFESLVNALIHRDYLILGSEVHIDMFDDRLTIYSPGGMPDGSLIQNRDISTVSSTRRNPVLADIFGRLGYMERQGSGLNKIRDAYESAANFRAGMEPVFYSNGTQFTVTLPNLNYCADDHYVAIDVAIDIAIDGMNATENIKNKVRRVYEIFNQSGIFGRQDISTILGESVTTAGILINKMKEANLIIEVKGQGKGKYRFIEK